MNLMDLFVRIGVEDEASDRVAEIGASMKSGLGAAGRAAGAAVAASVAAAGTAAAALGKSALDAYACWEQLVGGVDTLFKEASATVQANAAVAYQTAGVSANAYMEQATSFAASLVSSLGGDTQAAAAHADTAIRDMADNANKMGTDLGSLQYAYQGFAKQNFTMLDNLKLGYGGTQSEMQRLIDHANEVKEANGEMADLSIESFADVVDAIHIVQEEMGITGTTFAEGSSTIEGSIGTMKAAWENWTAGLGNSEADMQELTDQLVQSFDDVAQNVIPRLGVIFGTLVGEIPAIVVGSGPAISDALAQAFQQGADNLYATLPPSMQATMDELRASFESSGLSDAASGVFQSIGDTASAAADGIGRLADSFDGLSAMEAVAGLCEVVSGFFEQLSSQAGEYLMPAVENLQEQFGLLCDSLGEAQAWLEPLASFLADVFVAACIFVVDVLTLVVGVVRMVIDGITWLVETVQGAPEAFQTFCDDVGAFLQDLPERIWEWLQGAIDKVNEWGQGIAEKAQEAGSSFSESVNEFFSTLPQTIWGWLSNAAMGVVTWASDMGAKARQAGSDFLNGVGEFFAQLPANVQGFLREVIARVSAWVGEMGANAAKAAGRFGSDLINGLASIPSRVSGIGSQIIGGIVSGITGAAGRVVDAVSGAVGDAIAAAKRMLGIASPSKLFRKFGVYTMEGMMLGIESGASLPAKAMRAAVSGVEEAAVVTTDAQGAGTQGGDRVVAWLSANLPSIIANCTPVMGYDDFGRMARKAVSYA